MTYADLHVHTFYSDSTLSPEEVIGYAKDRGLAAVAICDHDSIDGIEPCISAAAGSGVEVIPAIELTAETPDMEIHMLGYFIDWTAGWFRDRLKKLQAARVDRIHAMVEKLNKLDLNISADDVFKFGGKGTIGRLHVAQALLKAGKIKNLKEAFNKYIGFSKPCYVSEVAFTPKGAIEIILKAGGVPVVAHPITMGKDEFIDEMIKHGLRGIEVYHTDHGPKISKHYEDIAVKNSLLMTGGSDCHGAGKGRVLIGMVRVPYDVVEKLKKESGKIRNEYK